MKMNHLFVLLGVMVATATAPAATVTFTLFPDEDGPGTFNLYADASLGDNFGIASYGVPLIGSVLTINHNSPQGIAMADGSDVGFRTLRSADDAILISASQNTLGPPPPVTYGFGQAAGTLPGPLSFSEQPTYDAHLLVATGTYDISGTTLNFDLFSPDLGANVFDSGVGTTVIGATINAVVVPEPAVLGLIGLGGLALMLLRRRCGTQC